MLGAPLESNARDLGIVTQLLPAEYVAAAAELCHAERLHRCRGAVHREGHFLFRDDRVELVETYWTGGLWGVEITNGQAADRRGSRRTRRTGLLERDQILLRQSGQGRDECVHRSGR